MTHYTSTLGSILSTLRSTLTSVVRAFPLGTFLSPFGSTAYSSEPLSPEYQADLILAMKHLRWQEEERWRQVSQLVQQKDIQTLYNKGAGEAMSPRDTNDNYGEKATTGERSIHPQSSPLELAEAEHNQAAYTRETLEKYLDFPDPHMKDTLLANLDRYQKVWMTGRRRVL